MTDNWETPGWKKARDQYHHKRGPKLVGNWRDLLIKGGKGKILPIYSNALLYLRHDPELENLFSYNQMRCEPMITRSEPTIITDDDISTTWGHLQAHGLPSIARSAVRHAIISRAHERPYHPIHDYLTALEWDGEARIATWLIDHLGCTETDYHKLVGRLFLMQAVARIFRPGCKADFMVILEGPQGKRKSMACEVMFGTEYFSDNLKLHDINKKDASQHLRGKWCVEFSEMDGLSKIDAASLKAFTTRTHERYRPSYGEMEVDEPRQCVFMGTSNKDVYLRDETGGRRFWGAPAGKIDIELLKHDRDQLWAEAVEMIKHGDQYWPTDEEQQKFIEPEQDARYEYDVWFDAIEEYVVRIVPQNINPTGDPVMVRRVSIPRIAKGALDMDLSRADQFVQKRIAAILRKLSWITYRTENERGWQSPHLKI